MKIIVYQGYEKQEWEEAKKGLIPGTNFFRDTKKKKFGGAVAARTYAGKDGGVVAFEVDEDELEEVEDYVSDTSSKVRIKDVGITQNPNKVKIYFRVPTSDTLGTSQDFINIVKERTRIAASWETGGKLILPALAKSFDIKITEDLGKAMIKDFWKGDLAAQKENLQKFGKEEIKIGVPKEDDVRTILFEKLDPVAEWNKALFYKLGGELDEGVRDGLTPSELAELVRNRMPEFINTEEVTIQHEGKRPVTMTTAHYTELMARTLPFTVRNAGYISRMQQFPDMYQGWKSICPDDERSCEECVEKMEQSDKTPFSWDDPQPPYHPFCILPGTYCVPPGGAIGGMKSFYEGPVVELTFSDGTKLSVTPNHMVLTDRGFAAAYLLTKGDKIFYCSSFKRSIPLAPDDNQNIPFIEDIFYSLVKSSKMSSSLMPSAPEYFHGDAKFINEDIDIVGSNRLLRSTEDTPICESFDANGFYRSTNLLGFDSFGSFTECFKRLLLAFDSSMGRIRKSSTFFLRRLAHSDNHSFASVSDLNALRLKLSMDNISGASKAAAQLLNRYAGFIELNEIVDIDIVSYHGYVYDLESISTFLICNGVVVSNCRCRPLAVAFEKPPIPPEPEGPEPEPAKPPEPDENFTFIPEYSNGTVTKMLDDKKILYKPNATVGDGSYFRPETDMRKVLGEDYMKTKRADYTYWYFNDLKWTSPGSKTLQTEPREFKGGVYVVNYGKYSANADMLNRMQTVGALSQRYQYESEGELFPMAGEKMSNGKDWRQGIASALGSEIDDFDMQVKLKEEMNFAAISTRLYEAYHPIDTWKKLSKEVYDANENDIMQQSKAYKISMGQARDSLLTEAKQFASAFKGKGFYTSKDKEGNPVTYLDSILKGDASNIRMYRAFNDQEWAQNKNGLSLFDITEAKDIIAADVVKVFGTDDLEKVNRITNTLMGEWRHALIASDASNYDYKKNGGDMSDLFNRSIMLSYVSPELAQESTPAFRMALYKSMKEGAMAGEEAAPLRAMFSAKDADEKTKLDALQEIIKGKPPRTILNEFPKRPSTIAEMIGIVQSPNNYILDFKPQGGKPLVEFSALSGAYGDCSSQGNHIRILDTLINKAQGRATLAHEFGHLTSYNMPVVENRAVYKGGYMGGLMRTLDNPQKGGEEAMKQYTDARITAFDNEAQRNAAFRERWEVIKEMGVNPTLRDQIQNLYYLNATMMGVSEERYNELYEMRKSIDDFLMGGKIETKSGSFHHGDMLLYGVIPRGAASEAEQQSTDAFKVLKGLKDNKPRNVSGGLKSNPSFVLNNSFIFGTTDTSAWDNAKEGDILVRLDMKGAHAVPINDKEWVIGRSHSLTIRDAEVPANGSRYLMSKEENARKSKPFLQVWVDPPKEEERGLERRCQFIDSYGEKPNFDRLAQNFGTTPKIAEAWFNTELANVGKMVRLSMVLDKEKEGEVGAFDEVLAVTEKWKTTLASNRWPIASAEGVSWNPDPKQGDYLYERVLKLPKGQIRAIVEALKDPVEFNKSLTDYGRMAIADRRLKELDAISPLFEQAVSRVKTSGDMSFFGRVGFLEENLEKGSILPGKSYIFGKTNVEDLLTPAEKAERLAKGAIGQPAKSPEIVGLAEIRLPKGSNALGVGKSTVIMDKNIELEYVRSYDHPSGFRVGIFQPKGAKTDAGVDQKTPQEQIEEEVRKLSIKNPSLAAMHQAKYAVAAQYSPGAGQPDIGITDFKAHFAKEFPVGYDPDKKEDILNYYQMTWLERAGDTLYSASKEWQTSAEERWAMFCEGVYMDPAQVEKLAPEPFQAFMKKLNNGEYGKGLPKILGRPDKTALTSESGIGIAKKEDVEKDLTKTWNTFKKEYSNDQIEKIASYRTEFYQKINGVHRGTTDVTVAEFNKISETTDLIDSAMHEIGLQGNVKGYVVGYRGFSHPELIQKWDSLQGAALENAGYTSISLDEEIAAKYAKKQGDQGIIAEVRVDPGLKGLYMDALVGPERGEKELLLPRNLRSTIVKNWIDDKGQKRMILEVSKI